MKNASQFVVIAATEPAGALAPVLAFEDVVADGAGEVAADVPAGADVPAELGPLLPHAARVTVTVTSAQAPASRQIWL
ncbi:MAG TPA: hypothetical protein VNW50_01760 [Streptosporangiaceae bacterium]|nr:hypothetical protein [Streptosporangiaceae bacterium]